MRALSILLLVAALVLLAALIVSGKPPRDVGVALVSERVYTGYDANPADGCLGYDEELEWRAEGSMDSGATFVYTPTESDCHAYRIIRVRAGTEHGHKNLDTRIELWSEFGQWEASGIGAACIQVPPAALRYINWRVTVTNQYGQDLRGVLAYGEDKDEWMTYPCP